MELRRVSKKFTDEEHQASLDKNFPFIEQGAQQPGRWVPDPLSPGSQKWVTDFHWSTRHGSVVVRWSMGKPTRIESARYPDGSRGIAEHKLDYGWRRQAADGRHWIHGTIDVQPRDVLFIDGTQPVYTPPENGIPNLEADLARDPEFLNALHDDRFANAVYVVFRNRTLYKGLDERACSCGDRQVAYLVRDLRGLGESYQDWFPYGEIAGTYPDDRPEREAWLRKTIEEYSRPISFPGLAMTISSQAQRASGPITLDQIRTMVASQTHSPEFQGQLEAMRAEFDKRNPQMEGERLKALASFQQSLAALDENADVFTALHGHITRLGWRTERVEDRERIRRKGLADAHAVLQEIKKLELRPESVSGDWAKSLGQGSGMRMVADADQLSEEEREVVFGRVRKRLIDLATSGRISKEEYDNLSARLKGY